MSAFLDFYGLCEPTNPGGIAVYAWVYRCEDLGQKDKGAGEACRGEGATNNIATYHSLGWGLRGFLERHAEQVAIMPMRSLFIRGSSQLVVNQVNRIWACKNQGLQKLLARCQQLIANIELLGIPTIVEYRKKTHNTEVEQMARVSYRMLRGHRT